MIHFDKVIGASALILGLFSVGGMLSTDAYLNGAKTQATSDDAMTRLITSDDGKVCLNDTAAASASAQAIAQ